MTITEALRLLRPPLMFGQTAQIAARRFLERVEDAKESILACDMDHKNLALERFEEAQGLRAKYLHVADMKEELFGCTCTPGVESDVLLEVARSLVEEWWDDV